MPPVECRVGHGIHYLGTAAAGSVIITKHEALARAYGGASVEVDLRIEVVCGFAQQRLSHQRTRDAERLRGGVDKDSCSASKHEAHGRSALGCVTYGSRELGSDLQPPPKRKSRQDAP